MKEFSMNLREFQEAVLAQAAEKTGYPIGLCPNCGASYLIGPDDDATVCSKLCFDEYLRYINEI